jgi:3-oxoacyl-[acyl-carrier-protein] synthase-3
MSASVVLACGAVVPPRTLTNEELAPMLDVSPAAIAERTGVARRHWVAAGAGPSDLGRDAAADALQRAGLGPDAIDLIVFATMTPDIAFPGSGCFLQDKLGCREIGALDIRAQCAGFLFGLATADRFVRAGAASCALVVGAEVHSTALDRTPRGADVTPRFGDGAGAMLVGPGDRGGVLATVLHSDPTDFERYWCEYPSSRHFPARMEMEHFERGLHYYVIDAPALDRQAEPTLTATVAETLAAADLGIDAIDLCVAHYLDPRVARRAARAAGFPDDRILVPGDSMGHVAAGGIPMALAEATESGRVGKGARVCCVAFGAGISWAGAVLQL